MHPRDGVVDRDARSGGQHRLALRARVRRLQSDSSHGAHGADVRLQAGGGARHVVARAAVSRSAAPHLPKGKMQVDTQFKLPVYIPSQALARTWAVPSGVEIAMCTMRGDRLHLAMQVRPL